MNNDIIVTVKRHVKIAAFSFLFILLTVGCGNGGSSSSNGGNGTGAGTATGTGTSTGTDTGTGTSTGTATGMGSLGINTKTIGHTLWVSTAPHSAFLCNDCHTVDNEVICSQSGCHPFSKYAALATNFNHVANTTGDWCNKCHSMIPEPAATDAVRIAGWREHVKPQLSDTIWHPGLKGACLNCHDPVKHDAMATMPNFPTSHLADTSRHMACESCHFYKLNGAGTGGIWGYTPHPAVTTGCTTATCHAHIKTTTETHYMGGTAPADQHYDANTGGPFSCEWCHSGAISSNYTSWAVAFDKTTHQSWNGGACKACHPTGTHPDVTTGCRTATCHTHTKPATQTHQESGYVAGQHYDANAGGSVGAGPFECEWCHKTVASGGYTSWSLTFSKSGHRKGTSKWDVRACGACHPNRIPD